MKAANLFQRLLFFFTRPLLFHFGPYLYGGGALDERNAELLLKLRDLVPPESFILQWKCWSNKTGRGPCDSLCPTLWMM